jgi:hypothetical protein
MAVAAASSRDFGEVTGSPVVELGQEDLGRGKRHRGELVAKGPEGNKDLQGGSSRLLTPKQRRRKMRNDGAGLACGIGKEIEGGGVSRTRRHVEEKGGRSRPR